MYDGERKSKKLTIVFRQTRQPGRKRLVKVRQHFSFFFPVRLFSAFFCALSYDRKLEKSLKTRISIMEGAYSIAYFFSETADI